MKADLTQTAYDERPPGGRCGPHGRPHAVPAREAARPRTRGGSTSNEGRLNLERWAAQPRIKGGSTSNEGRLNRKRTEWGGGEGVGVVLGPPDDGGLPAGGQRVQSGRG